MAKVGQPYTSGTWVVREGKEDDFIARWTEFTEWSLANAPGAESFLLIRQDADPRHFISFGAWQEPDAVSTWRATPEFQRRLGACRELCEDFKGVDHTLVVAVGA